MPKWVNLNPLVVNAWFAFLAILTEDWRWALAGLVFALIGLIFN